MQAPSFRCWLLYVLCTLSGLGASGRPSPPSRRRHPVANDLAAWRARQHAFCANEAALLAACDDACPELNITAETSHGEPFKIVVYQSQEDRVTQHLRQWHNWEGQGTLQMRRAIAATPGSTVLDIGGHVGWYTFSAAAQGAEVIAIEPLEDNLLRLRSSLCHNPALLRRVVVIPVGLGAANAQNCTLVSLKTNRGNGVLHCSQELVGLPVDYRIRQRSVQVARLDELLEEVSNIGFIKMDIEGHEPMAVLGGKHTFLERGVPFIMLEYNSAALARTTAPELPEAFLQQFVDAGYRLSLDQFGSNATWLPGQINHLSRGQATEVFLTHRDAPRIPSR